MRYAVIGGIALLAACSSSAENGAVSIDGKITAEAFADPKNPKFAANALVCAGQFILSVYKPDQSPRDVQDYIIKVTGRYRPVADATISSMEEIDQGSFIFHDDSDDTDFHAIVMYEATDVSASEKLRSEGCKVS